MSEPKIKEGDWVLICETGERGEVIEVFDEGERFLLSIPPTENWPHTKRMHVMVEKLRKIRTPKPEKPELYWEQQGLF